MHEALWAAPGIGGSPCAPTERCEPHLGRGVTVHTQLLSGLASGLHSGHSRGIGGSYAAEDGGPGAPQEKQEHSGRS